MASDASPYDSITFGNSLSLRVDGGVGAVSINPSGRDVVLAGRLGIYVVDLDDPFAPPRWLHHLTSWEVADVQWSPHSSKPAWVVSTSNQKAMVWNLARTASDAIEHILHGHSRAITDINFHPNDPELLATCSVDTFVHAWDMRSPSRPIYSVADWRAGASQVKWNFQNPNLLSSAHDNYIYVWDIRNNAKPLYEIFAHDRKVNGIDFSRTNENEIVSSSNDGTVKFWDISKDLSEPTSVINTFFPVWRARHLPFGNGCAIMPLRGGNDSIYLTNHKTLEGNNILSPTAVFKGHSGRVTDFLWRSRHSGSGVDDREFQLVTWSKDCDLRLWSLNEDIYEKLDFHRGDPMDLGPYDYSTFREEPGTVSTNQLALKKTKDSFVSNRGGENISTAEHLNWISGVRIGRSAFAQPVDGNPNRELDHSPNNLGEEVSVVGHKFPKIKFEKISVSTGILILSLNGPWGSLPDELLFLRVEINFPIKEYPHKPPNFRLEENKELNDETRQEIILNLRNITETYARFGKFPLEACLRYLMGEKIDLTNLENTDDDDFNLVTTEYDDLSSLNSSIVSSAEDNDDYYDDDEELLPMRTSEISNNQTFDSTPIPKGCGATWTKSGQLLCFFIPQDDDKTEKILKFDHKGFTNQVLFDDDNLSEDSLAEDWNTVLRKDDTTRSKITGVFKIQSYPTNEQFNKGKLPTEKSGSIQNTHHKNIVAIFDMRHLIPSKMELAEEYKLIGDTQMNLALHNSEICLKYGYNDLADSWKILSTLFDENFYWGAHPLGRTWFIKELMAYYEKLGNVQMLAMICCVIQGTESEPETSDVNINEIEYTTTKAHKAPSIRSSDQYSHYSDSLSRLPYSRSSSVITKDFEKPINVKIEMMNVGELGYDETTFMFTLLREEDQKIYNKYRDEYANILYSWGQVLRRAEVLKFNKKETCEKDELNSVRLKWVSKSHKNCSYCGLKVIRRLFVCHECEHVMHANCASAWFDISKECSSGCGCSCVDEYIQGII